HQRDRQDRTPLVLLGERLVKSADSVAIDSRAAARAATDHLVGLGRRRIGVIGAPPRSRREIRQPQEAGRRHVGYEKALEAAGLPYDPQLVITQPRHNPEEVASAVDRLLSLPEMVDAVFCFNDRVALGTIRELISRGLGVPDDVAVIGIDNIEGARLSTPSLSTIAPDKEGIARQAVEMLVERIGGGDRAARQVVAGFELIPRESTLGIIPAGSRAG
ncbi:MAG: LacI family DNA-binding transcriptional regulator, partial [Nocardioidaceae bacterium]